MEQLELNRWNKLGNKVSKEPQLSTSPVPLIETPKQPKQAPSGNSEKLPCPQSQMSRGPEVVTSFTEGLGAPGSEVQGSDKDSELASSPRLSSTMMLMATALCSRSNNR